MKKILFLVTFLFSAFINIYSQWEQLNGIGNLDVKALVSVNSDIFAGNFILTNDNFKKSDLGVFRSTNNGINWTITSLTKSINCLHFRNSRLFAGTNHEGLFYSDDYGANWVLSVPVIDVFSFASNSSHLFCCTASYLYSSTNNGFNWITFNTSATVLLTKENYFLAGYSNTLRVSSNNGINWINTSVGNQPIYSLATNGTDIFAGTYNGLYISTNNGYNWSTTTLGIGYWIVSILAFGNNLIISDNDGNGIYVSTNSGLNWLQKNEGMTGSVHIGILMNANGYVFAGGLSALYRRSLQNILYVNKNSEIIPNQFSLSQNYPNPFNPITNIKFQIANNKLITLKVFDILGKEVTTLVNEKLKQVNMKLNSTVTHFQAEYISIPCLQTEN